MQIKFPKFKKKAASKNKFSHSKWSLQNPGRHWSIAIILAFVLVLGSFGLGIFLYIEENSAIDALSFEAPKVSVETIKYERIHKVLNMFSDREKTSAAILNSPSAFSDPSL